MHEKARSEAEPASPFAGRRAIGKQFDGFGKGLNLNADANEGQFSVNCARQIELPNGGNEPRRRRAIRSRRRRRRPSATATMKQCDHHLCAKKKKGQPQCKLGGSLCYKHPFLLSLLLLILSLSLFATLSSRSLISAQASSSVSGGKQQPAMESAIVANGQAAASNLGAQILVPNSQQLQQQQSITQQLPASINGDKWGRNGPTTTTTRQGTLGAHFQPSFVLAARNRAINFTHLALDEAGLSLYVGANNWLLQVGAPSLKPEVALKTGPGPAGDSARDCSPADCPVQQPLRVDLNQLNLHHNQGPDLSIPQAAAPAAPPGGTTSKPARLAGQHHNLNQNYSILAASHRKKLSQGDATNSLGATPSGAPASSSGASASATSQQPQQQQQTNNNFNKLLVIEPESRQLIVCGSLNQGACRRHQLGALGNFSELIPMPVASNDEFSSNVASVVASSRSGLAQDQRGPVLYVAATNSRSDLYREMVPSISARYLEPASRAMQIIERSFTETAKIDISFELRDYYLVNYVHSFQHQDHIYFATNQRKSPLRQLEEWGHISRLARLCLGDLSFQSYTEISLECRTAGKQSSSSSSNNQQGIHYNLLQDAQLIQASNQLALQLGLEPSRAGHSVLVGVFSQSKDHTLKSQAKSAICLFPMEQIEAVFNENVASCLNGTSKTRDMNYIAGAVNDCPRSTGKQVNLANTCNEPIKLNGSIPLVAQPVISFEADLLTSVGAFWAPSSPVSSSAGRASQLASARQHQILLAGTSEGELKRIALLDPHHPASASASASSSNHHHRHFQQQHSASRAPPRGHLLDSVLISDAKGPDTPILADMMLLPPEQDQLQSALLATPNKIVKLRVNGCRLQTSIAGNSTANGKQLVSSCQACAALEDPLCGWCATAGSCTSRHACLQRPSQTAHSWQPFDAIRCTDYEPISPRAIPLQASHHSAAPGAQPASSLGSSLVEVNVPLAEASINSNNNNKSSSISGPLLAWKLAQAQFQCHFDYLALANRSQLVSIQQQMPITTAHSKATQARLNLNTGTVSIGCPLPSPAHRPMASQGQAQAQGPGEEFKVRLVVKLDPTSLSLEGVAELEQALGMDQASVSKQLRHLDSGAETLLNGGESSSPPIAGQIERSLTFYDCSQLTSCHSCTSSAHSCSWCPLSSRCTFNSSHPEFGCAASALMGGHQHHALQQQHHHPSSTPSSSAGGIFNANNLRPLHLTNALNPSQATMFGLSIDHAGQCPASEIQQQQQQQPSAASTTSEPAHPNNNIKQVGAAQPQPQEILVAHQSRRSIVIQLRPAVLSQIVAAGQSIKRSGGQLKVECLFELDEDSRARVSAKLVQAAPPESPNGPAIVCQEMGFAYSDEVATQRAQVQVVMNDNQIVETSEVILYKCHLFGVNPPALMSSLIMAQNYHQHSPSSELMGHEMNQAATTRSSAAWRAHELFQGNGPLMPRPNNSTGPHSNAIGEPGRATAAAASDCSLCANIERKFRCQWCQNACLFAEQCPASSQHQASSCPPPRIDSIRPTSGPLEGGTLITIEGSNLGSSEREIQDKITVGGLPCQLIMYSVSTRIVCKTSPASARTQPAASTLFVGNRAGVSSAHEMFHYKPVHLTGVTPNQGPVSGGTKLTLSGSNLNIGSRTQIFLDDIPCLLETHEMSSNQISCITGPNLQLGPMQISRLTLMIDNSTHHFPRPFTYQPDPIITSIGPAESFLSGGRLIMITGHHLSAPQSIKLMVYQEHKHQPINGTTCSKNQDTLITCLTPAIPRSLVTQSLQQQQQQQILDTNHQHQHLHQHQHQHLHHLVSNNNSTPALALSTSDLLSYQGGGFKLRMYLIMDDVKSVRNLEDYYHYLPNYLTYFEDPRLYRLPGGLVEYSPELAIEGDFLQMNDIHQDIRILVGQKINQLCLIKSIASQRLICVPPAQVEPQYDLETGRLLERANLPIVAQIGSHLTYQLGHMQYSSQQYLPAGPSMQRHQVNTDSSTQELLADSAAMEHLATNQRRQQQQQQPNVSSITSNPSLGPFQAATTIFIILSGVSFTLGLVASIVFAIHRSRQTKYERQYKRIQLQMGSLDINGQPIVGGGGGGGGGLFAQSQPVLIASARSAATGLGAHSYLHQQHPQQHHRIMGNQCGRENLIESLRQMKLRALDYMTGGNRLAAAKQAAASCPLVIGPDGAFVGVDGLGLGLGCGKAARSSPSSDKLFYGGHADPNNSLFAGPLAGDLIQANQQQHLDRHHLMLSKMTPTGKIVNNTLQSRINNGTSLLSAGRQNAIQRREQINDADADADGAGYYQCIDSSSSNFGGQARNLPASAASSSISPLVSYSSGNYTANNGPNNNNTNNTLVTGNAINAPSMAANGHRVSVIQQANNAPSSNSSSSSSASSSASSSSSNCQSANSSQQCSPGSSSRTPLSSYSKQWLVQANNLAKPRSIQHQQQITAANNQQHNSWTQEAPSTVLPYSVIEACNLTLEGKNAIKQFV